MSPRRKGLLLILDGLGDRPAALFHGATPLEAAHTPRLDRLAAAGLCGMVDPLFPGVPVATHTGTGILLGLAPGDAVRLSRGPVEAAGIGLPIEPGDVAIRCNFATLRARGDKLTVVDRRAGRIREGTGELAAGLQQLPVGDGILASLQPSTQHRAVLRLSGPGLSAAITDTDPEDDANPGKELLSRPLVPGDPAAARTAEALNRFIREAHKRLRDHPVNRERKRRGLPPATGIITRGAGMLHQVRNLVHHLNLRAALIAGEGSVRGLGRLFDYTVITEPGFSALPDTDLAAKVRAARMALDEHDLVFMHVKAPDICAHDLAPDKKRDFLERFDEAISPLFTDDLVIGVSGDHSTNSTTGNHCADPVPTLLHYPGTRRDGCRHFGESDCIGGGLGRIPATGFLLTLLDAMGAMHNLRPDDRIFFTPGL
ncbi:MAG TPA: 2,3-bisphosphoglycerate-independent phosphoglycerate mutase [Sedimenticola sp.]|nr:2,3-bisphosphoglycerate-independent phosphoglycerate mutase [Sedimenticola sp.]